MHVWDLGLSCKTPDAIVKIIAAITVTIKLEDGNLAQVAFSVLVLGPGPSRNWPKFGLGQSFYQGLP